MPPTYFQLTCVHCEHKWMNNPVELVKSLRQFGMLRRHKDPDVALLKELFSSAADRFSCPACENNGAKMEQVEDDWDDAWDAGRKCKKCSEMIPAERIEIFPDSEYCAKCQQAANNGDDIEAEYCPKCGMIMQMRQSGRGGVSHYVMYCPDCRR
ncbi:MAG: hypothetical protein ACI9G1_003063 [Pirellulaceae bacterium]|jgi:ssDNA-binding Zn-finger/Zn-ribbon topoisomerase 1